MKSLKNTLCLALINKFGISSMKTCPVNLVLESLLHLRLSWVIPFSLPSLSVWSWCILLCSNVHKLFDNRNSCAKLYTDKQSKLTGLYILPSNKALQTSNPSLMTDHKLLV